MSEPHALIAGAGIGGLSAALCLAGAGWRVSLFESAPAFEEVGAGLQLSPNASAILQRLNVVERLKASPWPPIDQGEAGPRRRHAVADAARRRRTALGAPYLLIHRADLQRALLQAVAAQEAISIHTGVAVAGFASDADGVVAALRQGLLRLEASGDCLIGADGARSLIRAKLLGARANSPALTRRIAWRALVDADRAAPEALRPQSCLWLGREAHLVHYPLRGCSVVNVVAVVDENEPAPGPEEDWSRPGDPAILTARFSCWHKDARALLAAAPEWRRWPLIERDPLPGWTAGRVALLGDAAHPMPPFLAQGAAQAIEDAAALGAALQATRDVAQGLAAYAAARRARADRVQGESRAQGRIYHLSGLAAFARDAALRALGGERLLARYDWLYGSGRN